MTAARYRSRPMNAITAPSSKVDLSGLIQAITHATADDSMNNVRDSAVRAAQEAAYQAKEAARVANNYAHDEPWRVASAALAVGALVGFLLARR